MWFLNDFFKFATGTALVLLILLLFYEVLPLLAPIANFIAAVLLPIMIAGLLYYILRPLVHVMEKRKIPRYIAILFIYCILFNILIIIYLNIAPVMEEITILAKKIPTDKIKALEEKIVAILNGLHMDIAPPEQIQNLLISNLQKINAAITHVIFYTFSTITNVALALLVTPFVLFYFLKDDHLFSIFILKLTPKDYSAEIKKTLCDIDETLATYISGQFTIACVLGLLLFLGYLIIGIKHALALALFGMIFYAVPFVGTIISLVPALIVGLSESSFMGVKVIIVMSLVHLLETNVITPKILGSKLRLHPLTIIFLLIAAGSLYGLVGLLLVTPLYAVLKILIWNMYKIWHLHYLGQAIKKEKKTHE